jgi:beta-lactamase class A
MQTRLLLKILLTLSLVLNVGLGITIFVNRETGRIEDSQLYPFLSKRIFVESQNDILINFTPLREAMNEHVPKMEVPVGVYYEYLPTGSSIGVNEKMEVKIASLIKIPIVMAVYKEIEKGNLSRDQILTITKERLDPTFGNLWKEGEGTKITVQEAINLTLLESDNTATNLLISILPADALDRVYNWLDVPKSKEEGYPTLSPKNYISILRSLYLSSYLTETSSNEILEVLTRTIFTDKLPAGVPPEIKVAHKIGVFRPLGSKSSDQIFSDCGIVYVPNRPYALCMMVQGDEEHAREYMKFISKMVYGFMAKINTKGS